MPELATQTRPLVDATALRFRGHMLDLISRAYTEISPARAASLLGIGERTLYRKIKEWGL